MRIVGYGTFIDLLKAAYALRLAGAKSAHVLVIGPPGVGKTSMAKLFAKAVGATFVRTTGRYDMLPEDFISEKIVEPGDDGKPTTKWVLHAVGKLQKKDNPKPGIWFFDEFDKMNRKSMMALLELMEEQQTTLPTGETIPLNFMLIAAGNSRKYDRDANPIPRAVRDRFVVFWELGYLPVEKEMEVLKQGVEYVLGRDTEPSEQFAFAFDAKRFEELRTAYEQEYGDCVVKAVASLRSDRAVEEPPGPRAYIHAILLAAALSAVRSGRPSPDDALLAFQAAVAGKITVAGDESPFDLCQRAFETYCMERPRRSPGQGFFRPRGRRRHYRQA